MARLWTCGFELNSLTNDVEIRSTVGTPGTPVGSARSGFRGLETKVTGFFSVSEYIDHTYKLASGTIYTRFYMRITTAPGSLIRIARHGYFLASHTHRASIRMNTNRTLELWEESTGTQQGSDSAALNLEQWYRIEMSYVTATGAIDARIDGVSFATGTTSTGSLNNIQLGIVDPAIAEFDFDDCAANDATGSYQNTWCGEGRIFHGPAFGDGDTQNGSRTGTDSGTNYGQVDEVTPNDGTDSWDNNTNGDIFEIGQTLWVPVGLAGANAYPVLVHVGLRLKQTTAGRWTLVYSRLKSQSGGTTVESGATFISSNIWRTNEESTIDRHYQLTQYVDPQSGGPWKREHIGTMQLGLRTTSFVGAWNLSTSTIWSMVETRTRRMDIINGTGVVPVNKNAKEI